MTCSPADRGKRRRPHSSQHEGRPSCVRGHRQDGCVTAERVAESVRGSDEQRSAGPVAERLANLGDQVREVGLGDERVGPEPLLQRGFDRTFGRSRTSATSSSNAFGDR